jgi:hypothetical protein
VARTCIDRDDGREETPMTGRSIWLLTSLGLLLSACGDAPQTPEAAARPEAAPTAPPAPALPRKTAPSGARAYIVSPVDGARVTSPVRVVFGLKGAGVAPAGVDTADTGHHHLLIDTGLPDLDVPIPVDAQHVHFGAGQTEADIELPPGTHTLQLLLGDHLHLPHDPPLMSDVVTIEVQ